MGLKQQLIGILQSRDTQRIHFSFTGTTGITITVNGESFSRVANALAEDRIHIVEGGARDGMAMYSARLNLRTHKAANTFYIGTNDRSSRDFDGLMIHESVHASFDLTRSTLPWLDNEVAAYIAQGYYMRNTGYPRNRFNHLGLPYYGLMIVDSIIRGDGIDQFWLREMHGSLESDETYHDYIRGTFEGNG